MIYNLLHLKDITGMVCVIWPSNWIIWTINIHWQERKVSWQNCRQHYWNTWGGWTKYWEVLKTIGSDISLQPCWFLNTNKNYSQQLEAAAVLGNILQFVKILISDVCSPGSDSDLIFCDRFQFVQDEIKFISEWSSLLKTSNLANNIDEDTGPEACHHR